MTEMGINRRNRQIINKNANEMAKGPFEKVAILAKMRIWGKLNGD